jgi:predicted ArsR family transcriptional regulator
MDTPITRRGGADRPDTALAAAVDLALAVLEQDGARAAAAFLEQRGARFAMTCRVLAEPTRRRSVDLPPPPG